jgi:hypothetical protein
VAIWPPFDRGLRKAFYTKGKPPIVAGNATEELPVETGSPLAIRSR